MNERGKPVRIPSIARTLFVSLVVRLWLAGVTGLGIDESYAVTVARPFSLSYFDHPPLHFWIVGVMTAITQSVAPIVVRLPFVLLFTVTLYCIGALTTYLFSERAGRLAVFALAASGVLGVTTGTWVLPDGPLDAATSAAALLLAPLLVPKKESAHAEWWRWPAAGIAMALALMSKYHGALIAVGLLGYLLTTAHGRQVLRTSGPWLMAAIALLGVVPPLWWNANHHWVSFAFQGARAIPRAATLAPFAENVGGQLLYLLPWIAVPLAIALVLGLRAGRAHLASWYCVWLAIVPVALFTLVTLGGSRGLPHWQAPGWLFAFPLLGAMADHALAQQSRWPTRWLGGSVIATTTLLLLLVAQTRWGILDPFLSVKSRAADPTLDAVSWESAVQRLETGGRFREDTTVLLARNWMQAGKLGLALGEHSAYLQCFCDDARHFAFRFPVPRLWTHAVLVERLRLDQPSWTPATSALASDSLRITLIDTVEADRGVRFAIYDVVKVARMLQP